MEYKVKILMTEFVTHDVKRFIVEKPEGYEYIPGQATELSILKWPDKKNPFTFTSLNKDKVLEFTIKGYPEHNGVTKELHNMVPGDELILRDVWGAINYSGKGTFIAGGAGITPFIAILRQLKEYGNLAGNRLLFSNKTRKDVILWQELEGMLGDDLVLTFTEEEVPGHDHGRIGKEFLKKHVKDFSQKFYVCGPEGFIDSIKSYLKELGVKDDAVVMEL